MSADFGPDGVAVHAFCFRYIVSFLEFFELLCIAAFVGMVLLRQPTEDGCQVAVSGDERQTRVKRCMGVTQLERSGCPDPTLVVRFLDRVRIGIRGDS